ncbi:hypothetical protein GCM10010435_63120 [Winogradskya consettensis]|uniref:Uncharacterized protein n=1 Tax=Winogradskya consettensis TaxID=113560 RepID=A0A919T380_9ACTN|nr:hypothetical protein [Actinoplanes consettensis]GIM83295.1 hypothetical protein Aco04nite_85840 [Actinoplanes consettensis]
MATDGSEQYDRIGRISLAAVWGSWIIGSGVNELAEGEWPGWIFATIGGAVRRSGDRTGVDRPRRRIRAAAAAECFP